MLTATVLVVCAFALVSVATPTDKPYYDLEQAEQHFEQFMRTHGKTYANEQEKQRRFEIFKQRLSQVNELNAKSEHAVFGYTRYSDMAVDEVFKPFTPKGVEYPPSFIKPFKLRRDNISFPESFDWRKKNVVTPVKDQMVYCNSGWAFAAVGALEGIYAIVHNELVEFSVQQLLDCDNGNQNCFGGQSILGCFAQAKMGGAVIEKDYSYAAQQTYACMMHNKKIKVTLGGALLVNIEADSVFMLHVLFLPTAVGIDSTDIQQYRSGIITSCSYTQKNHDVLVVGYGTENDIPFWIIKNSWGTSWGEDGYFRLKRGINACGINDNFGFCPYIPANNYYDMFNISSYDEFNISSYIDV